VHHALYPSTRGNYAYIGCTRKIKQEIYADAGFLGAPWILAAPITTDSSPPGEWGSPCGVLRFDVSMAYSTTGRLRYLSWQSGQSASSLTPHLGSNPSNATVGGVLNVLKGLHVAIRLKVAENRSGTLFDVSARESGTAGGAGANGSPSGFVRLHFDDSKLACSVRPHNVDTSSMNLNDYTANITLAADVWLTAACTFTMGASGASCLCLLDPADPQE
jgi:hypothetical protein